MKNYSAVAIEKVPLIDIAKLSLELSQPASFRTDRWTTRLPVLALLSSLLIVLAVSRTPQSMFADPSWQLKGLQQYLYGESPTLNTLIQPNPRNLSQDSREWISWWPLGTNALLYPLLRVGLRIGAAIRVLAALAFMVGSFGFGYWLRAFRLPQWLAVALAISIPWIRYANLSLFQYGDDLAGPIRAGVLPAESFCRIGSIPTKCVAKIA
jgi:hypothetical protein